MQMVKTSFFYRDRLSFFVYCSMLGGSKQYGGDLNLFRFYSQLWIDLKLRIKYFKVINSSFNLMNQICFKALNNIQK
jgi:hypothetical protein